MTFVLVTLLVVGGTMAWFTHNPDPITNTFTAGTVEIVLHDKTLNEHEEEVDFDLENGITNVNPGDEYDKIVYVENLGSKKVYVRVELTPLWTLAESKQFPEEFDEDSMQPAELIMPDLTDWIYHGGYYYYKYILENKDATTGKVTTNLITGVKFIGADMGNEYQGATFELEVKAEAVQASYAQAMIDEWEVNPADILGLQQPPQ